MNPRTDLTRGRTITARAFVELFRRHDSDFIFGIDTQEENQEELRAEYLSNEKRDDRHSEISVTAINNSEVADEIRNTLDEMGLTISKDEESIEEYEGFRYNSRNIVARAEIVDERDTTTIPRDMDAINPNYIENVENSGPDIRERKWNVPNLVVYGSLSPEVEEICRAALGNSFTYENIRNHFTIHGENLPNDAKTRLLDELSRSDNIFESDRKHVRSNINTADFI